jgi:hypothetical protein
MNTLELYFVGRRQEIAGIRKTIERGDHVIVRGKYGIGRTSLLRHIAELTQDRWRWVFVDFAQPGGAVCRNVFAQLFPQLKDQRKGAYLPYKLTRFEVVHLKLDDTRPLVLVLDNIATLSAQKVNFLRYLVQEKRFRVVTITESFLPVDQFRRLRIRLSPASVVTLDYLNLANARQFFSYYSERYGFGWTPVEIHSKALTTGGYPLGMREVVLGEIERRKTSVPTGEYRPSLMISKENVDRI